ncbi:MAG TPA: sigma factor [Gemmatimonadales bacterium]|nr:sigma factor [Gemmatimonadales bacterium]
MTYQLTSDAQLIERMATGDGRAREEFSNRHRLSLYARVYALLADTRATDEVLSETFELAFHGARRFNPDGGSAVNWLTEIARGLVRRRQPPAFP